MNRFLVVLLASYLAFASNAFARGSVGSFVIAEGFSAENSYSGPMPPPFEEWCGGICFPTVTLEVVDSRRAKHVGFVHAWGKEPTATEDGSTIQFKEFIIAEFRGGQVWTISTDGGHAAGTFADPGLIPPKFGAVVLVGGAEGEVIGGTGWYRKAKGAYSTRLKLEADADGNFIYYDELFFRFREVFVW